MDWFRWWHGTVTDPKLQRVARMAAATTGEVIAVWACLLERASSVTQCDASVTQGAAAVTRGAVAGFDCDDHDVLLGFEDGKTTKILAALHDRGLIADGRIARWDERQPKREDSSAARTAAYRERKKAAQAATPSGTPVTPSDAPEGDTEKDKSNNPLGPPAGGKSAKSAPKSQRGKPRRVLPVPFLVALDQLEWARERAPAVNLDLETERFVNYWRSEGAAKADWDATWRNWVLRAQGDLEKRGLAKAAAGSKGPDDTGWIDEDDGL